MWEQKEMKFSAIVFLGGSERERKTEKHIEWLSGLMREYGDYD